MPLLPPDHNGSWSSVNWTEVVYTALGAAFVGFVHALYMLQKGRRFRILDFCLEPLMAILAGMMIWGILKVTSTPDVLQGVLTSLGAWGGPKTIHWLELKYLGGTRHYDTNVPDDDEDFPEERRHD